MCGIIGYISNVNKISGTEISESVNSLLHRGPDNKNIWYKDIAILGHTRLSIIDLSDNANQPMISKSGKNTIIFNGEIYNYKKLAAKYNIESKTSSDTEILLEAYEKVGSAILDELNGMFAFAIYNLENQELFLARDRMGINPLFYYFDKNVFAFASEIKALLKIEHVQKNKIINRSSISLLLNLGYIPEPDTFFGNIKKFPSGHYGILKTNEFNIYPFWKIEDKILTATSIDFIESKSKLDSLLQASVERRMISDVPLGTFLSGGIDSSLITSYAQKISKTPVKTFTIGYKESKFNESDYARKVAEHLKTDHHEFIVSEKDIIELVDDFFHTFDEPFADSSGFPTMLVSKLAKKYVTVILSGDGGDELFHGYGAYNWAKRLNYPLIKSFRKPIAGILSMQSDRNKRVAEIFRYQDKNYIKSHIFSQEQFLFSSYELENLLIDNDINHIDEGIISPRELTKAEEQSIFDMKYYLKDDLLTKVDRASMRYAIEVRVPFLDHNVVEFAINLHHNLKIKNGEQKYLLKQLLYDYVPKEYFDRPKWGFSIPLGKWLKNELSYLLNKYLSEEFVSKYNLVKYSEVKTLKEKYLKGQEYLYNRLWALIVLHYNFEKYSDVSN